MPASMTPAQFVAKWSKVDLPERAASQEHFIDLCALLGQPTPAGHDATGAEYAFEKGVAVTAGASRGAKGDRGFADVWWRGKFAWEYKRRDKYKDLSEAYGQLCQYREALDNPPLLIVSDIGRTEIHTNFTGTAKQVHAVTLAEMAEPRGLDLLRRVFTDPESFRPTLTPERVTEEVAREFAALAGRLRPRGHDPHETAHFLMKCMFCLFAEDIRLLPAALFQKLLNQWKSKPSELTRRLTDLFDQMRTGGAFGVEEIPWFNGGLFDESPALGLTRDEVDVMLAAARHDWGSVEPAVFGTLFERSLDPNTRAQIGAHYTSRDDILLIVEPVVMAPLRREWEQVKADVEKLLERRRAAKTKPAQGKADKTIEDGLRGFIHRLSSLRILDPACGSGNFLYVALQLLLDLEKAVITFAARPEIGIGLFPQVRPTQLHGIEINPYAAELAQVVIWIGYLQWMRDNGFNAPRNPVLEPLQTIECRDAILDLSDPNNPKLAQWPEADFVIGNPPFLGGKMLRANLGDEYVDALFKVWAERVPREADLCCYWFEKARSMIEAGRLKRAGLLATQGIRGGANREVLKRIKDTGDIFFAVSDRDWILDGANVHVSMVGFDDGTQTVRSLDGASVQQINPELTSTAALSSAASLRPNHGVAFMGVTPSGSFEIPESLVKQWIAAPNPSGRSNRDVLRPWINGSDITTRSRGLWIVDFGCDVDMQVASQYEAPFEHVRANVAPRRAAYRTGKRGYWCFERPRPEMRAALTGLVRYAATLLVSKHRMFVWVPGETLCANLVIVFARDDDYFFGVLHSAIHERWSRRMGTQLREAESGCRYTPTTCFETFPFPPLSGGIAKELPVEPPSQPSRAVPGPVRPVGKVEPDGGPPGSTDDSARTPRDRAGDGPARLRTRIAGAAARLNELRENWLNPKNPDGSPALSETQLKKRTLTNLYNDRPTWLELAHLELDRAVLAAYGWPEEWAEKLQPKRDAKGKVNPILGVADPATEQEVLARLLALNLSMAKQ
jgi:hypothetical protein